MTEFVRRDLILSMHAAREFIKTVLPPPENDEVYLLLLAARKKYWPQMARSEEAIRLSLLKDISSPYIERKLIETSIVYDPTVSFLFTDKQGQPIPFQAFALYIVLDPKSMMKAAATFIKEYMDMLYQISKGDTNLIKKTRSLDRKLFSAIHRAKSRKLYFLIDIDKKDEKILQEIVRFLKRRNIQWVSETRNGYHIIVKASDETGKLIFRDLKEDEKFKELFEKHIIEIKKDPMTPVVGTFQGGFAVRKVDL